MAGPRGDHSGDVDSAVLHWDNAVSGACMAAVATAVCARMSVARCSPPDCPIRAMLGASAAPYLGAAPFHGLHCAILRQPAPHCAAARRFTHHRWGSHSHHRTPLRAGVRRTTPHPVPTPSPHHVTVPHYLTLHCTLCCCWHPAGSSSGSGRCGSSGTQPLMRRRSTQRGGRS